MNKIIKPLSLTLTLFLTACMSSSEPEILEVKKVVHPAAPTSTIEFMLIHKDNVCLLKTKIISNHSTAIEKDWAFMNGKLILISESPTSKIPSNADSSDAKIEEQIRQMNQNKEANELKGLLAPENLKKCQSLSE